MTVYAGADKANTWIVYNTVSVRGNHSCTHMYWLHDSILDTHTTCNIQVTCTVINGHTPHTHLYTDIYHIIVINIYNTVHFNNNIVII